MVQGRGDVTVDGFPAAGFGAAARAAKRRFGEVSAATGAAAVADVRTRGVSVRRAGKGRPRHHPGSSERAALCLRGCAAGASRRAEIGAGWPGLRAPQGVRGGPPGRGGCDHCAGAADRLGMRLGRRPFRLRGRDAGDALGARALALRPAVGACALAALLLLRRAGALRRERCCPATRRRGISPPLGLRLRNCRGAMRGAWASLGGGGDHFRLELRGAAAPPGGHGLGGGGAGRGASTGSRCDCLCSGVSRGGAAAAPRDRGLSGGVAQRGHRQTRRGCGLRCRSPGALCRDGRHLAPGVAGGAPARAAVQGGGGLGGRGDFEAEPRGLLWRTRGGEA
mmetsp:Transcript_58184/g.166906  ORF Transcript_58184/g.166906 Transcript_58184/m.166906 type:complete len:338 (-) Transcript_58184:256-1269(-)